ncbi:MAG: hypothetical protein QHI48_12375 [Bacteroidota bacterium]|nr:hypothetical protein [Bacteroidota bacterium]
MNVTPRRYRSARGNILLVAPICIICGILFLRCHAGDEDMLSREEFVAVTADAALIRHLHAGDSSACSRALDSLYAVRGITRERVRRTVEWYGERPEELARVLSDAASILEWRVRKEKRP